MSDWKRTTQPSTSLHVAGNLALDPGTSPVLYTGTGDREQNRYLQLINSPQAASASGLKAGGLLVADSYDFANPSKNELVVKGTVGVGGDVTTGGTITATSATIRGAQTLPPPGPTPASVVLNADFDIANVFIVSSEQPPGSGNGIVQLSSVPGLPGNGPVFVTDVVGLTAGITISPNVCRS